MVSLQRITFVAALSIGVGIAMWPSVGRAAPPPSSPGSAVMTLIEQEFLEPAKKYVRLKQEILAQLEGTLEKEILKPLSDCREKEQKLRNLIEEYAPWRQRDSGGVRQLHPVRGTSLIRNDYAQQTLEEDWFLAPQFRTAALHLDVPYDADVSVRHPYVYDVVDGHEKVAWRTTSVRSRGRYRHLSLTDLPRSRREPVEVRASVWTKDPRCDAEMTTLCKKTDLQAGDRRHLAFPEGDFLAMAPPVVGFIAAAAPAPAPTPASKPATPSGFSFDVAKFPFEVTDSEKKTHKALLAYAKYGGPGGTAKSFAFSKTDKFTPAELKLIHDTNNSPQPPDPTAKVKVKLKLTWKAKDPVTKKETTKERSQEFTGPDPFQFTYSKKAGEGTGAVKFEGKVKTPASVTTTTVETKETKTTKSADEEKTVLTTVKKPPKPEKPEGDLRWMIETELPAELSDIDQPGEITVKGEVKFGDPWPWLPIDNSFKIIVM